MTALAFVLFAVAVAVMVLVHRHTQRRLAAQLLERERELNEYIANLGKVQQKQAKVFVRKLARTERLANQTLDQSRDLNAKVAAALSDPRVERLLNEGKSRR